MNLAFKIMAFSIFLNVSIGIMMVAITDIEGCPIFGDSSMEPGSDCYQPERTAGLSSDNDIYSGFIGDMNQTVTPESSLADKGDDVYRVLDLMNLGFIQRILNAITDYMYGFVVLLDEIFGSYLNERTNTLLFGKPFGFAYLTMTFIYIITALSLWTGRNYNE